MKKFLLPLLVLFFFTACEQENAAPLTSGQKVEARTNPKVHICHNGHDIYVSVNALPAHLAHLDGSDAVDMDGDGAYDKESECGDVDCDDTNPNVTEDC